MREAVEMIVKGLVGDADAVDVREIEGERATIIEVRVGEGDVGKVIGRQGKTIKALRSLMYAVSLKRGRRFVIEIVE
jgi:predicted RNA-binding protein YlqC (UPF0109 family)